MSEVKLTDEQLAVVSDEGGALLVSAAAGSGKTKVLVERLMRKVDEENSLCDIDDFLIITYTNAAASELRGKIMDAISDRMALNPDNKRLRRQADKCSNAEIETIHSFCSGVIRENAQAAGINPDFRVADESECASIKNDVLKDLIEECYDSGKSGFYMLADTLGSGRDDSGLLNVILDTHTKILSHPYPEKWVEEQLLQLNMNGVNDAAQTVWGKEIITWAESWEDYWEGQLENLLKEAGSFPDFERAYGESIRKTFDGLMKFKSALKNGWDKAGKAVREIEFTRAKQVKGFDNLKAVRNEMKKGITDIKEAFSDNSEKVVDDMKHIAPMVSALLNLVLEFDRRYSREKRRIGVIDFSDQEHLALRILMDEETGKPTETAVNLSNRYEEIMVDEYQDVNAVQELIFGAVSREGKNIFMVGDVKQSIYRFRLADPTIFIQKYNRYKDAAEAKEGEERKLILSRNFRSRSGILEAVNFVFRNVMSKQFGDIDYTDREALYPGLSYPKPEEESVELDILDMKDTDQEDRKDKTEIEAKFAAGRIKDIIKNTKIYDGNVMRPAKYGDIAVIMRSPRSRAPIWASVLEAENIPVSYERDSNFFDAAEIATAVSLLSIIDNPHQDIPLAAVMKSPIFRFTSDELGKIRAECRGGDYYTAVCKYAETDEKCNSFINELHTLREDAEDMPVDEFMWHLFDKTGYFAYVMAMPEGRQRKKNLMILMEYARQYENSGFKGLFSFVSYINRLISLGENPSSDEPVKNNNAVTLMSIHKSKGLEFPIVILADMTHRFNTDDLRKPLLIHPQLGAGPKYIDLERRVEYPTIARRAVKLKISSENLSEELRILYVAMTRAKEKLIMLCTYSDAEKELNRLSGSQLPVLSQLLSEANCASEWVLRPALRRAEADQIGSGQTGDVAHSEGERWLMRVVKASDILKSQSKSEKFAPAEGEDSGEYFYPENISNAFSWKYQYLDTMNIPSKLTATELKGNFASGEAHEEAQELQTFTGFKGKPDRPDFVKGSRKMTPAQRGTATHLVLQYADYYKCLTVEGVEREIERMVKIHNLSPEQAKSVNSEIIASFFNSSDGALILNADHVWREFKFSTLMESSMVPGYAPGEQILLQGVVDCCAEKDGKLTIIDFKTDHVTSETIQSRSEYYRGQVYAYTMAVEKIFRKPVVRKVLYFLSEGISIAF